MTGRAKLVTVASKGDRLKTLERLRDEIARAIDEGPPPRDLAALSRQMQLVLAEVDALKESDDGDLGDELQRRRLARQERMAGS